MFIKHLIGPRKGEIEDVVFESARAKVLSGEAEDVYNQLHIAPKPVSIAPANPVEAEQQPAVVVPVTSSGPTLVREFKKKLRR